MWNGNIVGTGKMYTRDELGMLNDRYAYKYRLD